MNLPFRTKGRFSPRPFGNPGARGKCNFPPFKTPISLRDFILITCVSHARRKPTIALSHSFDFFSKIFSCAGPLGHAPVATLCVDDSGGLCASKYTMQKNVFDHEWLLQKN